MLTQIEKGKLRDGKIRNKYVQIYQDYRKTGKVSELMKKYGTRSYKFYKDLIDKCNSILQ